MGNLGKAINKTQDKVNNYMEQSSTGRTLQRIVRSDPVMGIITGENPMERWDKHTDWKYHTDSPLFNTYGKSREDASKYMPKDNLADIYSIRFDQGYQPEGPTAGTSAQPTYTPSSSNLGSDDPGTTVAAMEMDAQAQSNSSNAIQKLQDRYQNLLALKAYRSGRNGSI